MKKLQARAEALLGLLILGPVWVLLSGILLVKLYSLIIRQATEGEAEAFCVYAKSAFGGYALEWRNMRDQLLSGVDVYKF